MLLLEYPSTGGLWNGSLFLPIPYNNEPHCITHNSSTPPFSLSLTSHRSFKMRVPNSIVVGIEVEFLAAQHASDETKKATKDTRWACEPLSPQKASEGMSNYHSPSIGWIEAWTLQKGCEVLSKAGLSVACPFPDAPRAGNPIHDKALSAAVLETTDGKALRVWNSKAKNGTAKTTDFWFLVKESHITKDLLKKPSTAPSPQYNFVGIELNSPILADASEFSRGLPTLNNCLAAIRNSMVVGLNAGCGLHVHVSDGGKLPLKTAQRAACLVMLLEDSLLMPLSHPHRRTSPYSMRVSTEAVVALSEDTVEEALCNDGDGLVKALSILMGTLKGRKKVDPNVLQAMKRVYNQKTIHGLGLALRKFDEGPVHTTTRCALVVSKHDSIEFRYPAATFDVEYVSGWVRLARHIFAMTVTPSDQEFAEEMCRVYEMVTRDEAVGWETVMTEGIGFGEMAPEEWKKCMKGFEQDLDKQGILPRR